MCIVEKHPESHPGKNSVVAETLSPACVRPILRAIFYPSAGWNETQMEGRGRRCVMVSCRPPFFFASLLHSSRRAPPLFFLLSLLLLLLLIIIIVISTPSDLLLSHMFHLLT